MNREKEEVLDELYEILSDGDIDRIEKRAGTSMENIYFEPDETENYYNQHLDFDGEVPINMFIKDEKGTKKKIGTVFYKIKQKNYSFSDLTESMDVDKIKFK